MKRRCGDRRSAMTPGGRRTRGFTLIELLVVVAVIAVLASLLLPALSAAKGKGQSAVCLGNHRQVSVALYLYTTDFEDQLPNNFGASGTRAAILGGRFDNWATSLLNWDLDPANTNRAWLQAGGLGPFLSGGVEVLRCPADRVVSDLQRRAGWSGRARSMSMNAMVGNAGEFMLGYSNTNNPGYRQYLRLGAILAPATLFTLIDEHPDSINDGYFLNRLGTQEWTDLPGSHHHGGASVSFADGHTEHRRWRWERTRPAARPDAAPLPMAVPEAEDDDLEWLLERTTMARPAPAAGSY